MESVPTIRIEFELGARKLKDVMNDVIRQAVELKGGNRFHAAVALGISPATLINRIGTRQAELARSDQEKSPTGVGPGVSPPPRPGGQEVREEDSGGSNQGSGDPH